MRVLIVDDEPLAREALEQTLVSRPDIQKLDTAVDAVEALDKIEKESYDVILLDIHMPELSGIAFAASLNKRGQKSPAIIFVTAHHEHAVAAFESHAVDYVLKPFAPERIHEAINVAFERSESERVAKLMKALPQLETQLAKRCKIAVKSKGRILFVDPANVVSVEAQGNYVLLQGPSCSYLLRETISTVAEKLKPYGFIRIHRSIVVNASFVEELQPWPTGDYMLRVKGGRELTVSRTYKSNLNSIARSWIGSDSFGDR